jgi:hypothetical protein
MKPPFRLPARCRPPFPRLSRRISGCQTIGYLRCVRPCNERQLKPMPAHLLVRIISLPYFGLQDQPPPPPAAPAAGSLSLPFGGAASASRSVQEGSQPRRCAPGGTVALTAVGENPARCAAGIRRRDPPDSLPNETGAFHRRLACSVRNGTARATIFWRAPGRRC